MSLGSNTFLALLGASLAACAGEGGQSLPTEAPRSSTTLCQGCLTVDIRPFIVYNYPYLDVAPWQTCTWVASVKRGGVAVPESELGEVYWIANSLDNEVGDYNGPPNAPGNGIEYTHGYSRVAYSVYVEDIYGNTGSDALNVSFKETGASCPA